MTSIRLLNEAQLRQAVAVDREAVACVEQAFQALATKAVSMPPILRLDIPEHHGEVDVKTAYVPGLDSFAIKMSTGFFDNPALGLPSLGGLMILFSAKTGVVEALLLDNGYLTDVRTAAAGAVAAKYLARDDAKKAAVFGAGVQARLQLKALMLVRPIEQAALWARRPEQARSTADELSKELGIPVEAKDTPRDAARGADILVTTTPAEQPILQAAWLEPGQHITAMGSDSPHKNEIEPALVAAADLYVADRRAQCAALGELHHAIAAGAVPADFEAPELGEILAAQKPGRLDRTQVTLADLTGTGVQDTAIATLARAKAQAANAGVIFES
ncbi:cyclodeaminase [Limibacillus sp. MBR-115]|jgi:ornithine cyclodeaminase|uniref:cyclodeaminase n=1 Tax=Limibacillus sp. MBR-115 TaxID=3156465 RepID=UPI00339474BA